MFKFWILILNIFVVYCFLVLPIKYYSFHQTLLYLQIQSQKLYSTFKNQNSFFNREYKKIQDFSLGPWFCILDVWWQRMEMMMRKSDHRGLNLTRSRDNHVHCTKHLHWCVHLIWSNVDWHLFTSSNLFFYSTYTVYTVNSQTCFVLYSMEFIGKQGRHTVFFLLKFAWWSYNCKYGQAHDTGLVSTTRLDIFVNALQL